MSNDNPETPRLGRRSLVLRLSALGLAGGATAACVPDPAYGPVTMVPPARAYTGVTDADPSDGPGYGRGGFRRPGYTGLTDADPSDGPGYGRGGYRRSGYTGLTDADPSDGPGYGRGGYRRPGMTGLTDSDPRDTPGRGRRGW